MLIVHAIVLVLRECILPRRSVHCTHNLLLGCELGLEVSNLALQLRHGSVGRVGGFLERVGQISQCIEALTVVNSCRHESAFNVD